MADQHDGRAPAPSKAHGADSRGELREAPPFPDRDLIDREFTPDRIEAEGRWLIYRALNTHQVVGFVGSGIGSAYGRPSWWSFVDEAYVRVTVDDPPDARRERIRDAISKVRAAIAIVFRHGKLALTPSR